MTGTDLHKLQICLAVLAGQFSQHCQGDSQFTIEQVEVHYEDQNKTEVFQLTPKQFEVEVNYINRTLGVNLNVEQITEHAKKMGLIVQEVKENNTKMVFDVPLTRADVMHACDVAEDIGIGFGYNNIVKAFPPTNTVGKQIPLLKFSDLIRSELAQAGYIESLTMSLLSKEENYHFLRKEFNADEAVELANPKTQDFQMVRTTLVPGLLKVFQSNTDESVSTLFNNQYLLDPSKNLRGH